MEKIVRWGFWGAGAVAELVAQDFRLAHQAVLRAVAARKIERAREFATRHGISRACGDLDDLLSDPDIDAVYVSTPHHCHMQDALACIRAGKAVLCEKPFSLNLAEAQRITSAARQHRVFCMEGMWTRFIPAVCETKKRLAAGAIGATRLIQGNFAYPAPRGPGSRFFNLETGGGALLDRGVYLISLAQYLLGPPESQKGTACIENTGVDGQCAFELAFDGGKTLASFAASLNTRGTNEVHIWGERGSLRLCEPFYRAHRLVTKAHDPAADTTQSMAIESRAPKSLVQRARSSPQTQMLRRKLSALENLMRSGRASTYAFPGNGYQFEIDEVGGCLREGRLESATMPLNDSLDVMRIMDSLRYQWGLVYPQESPRPDRP